MRTAVVERKDAPILVHEQDRAVAAVHNQPTLVFQLLKTAGRARNPGSWYPWAAHPRSVRSAPFGKDIPRMSIRSTDISQETSLAKAAIVAPN
jgi:hypothetical protein